MIRRYYQRKKYNKIGMMFMVPYLFVMSVSFDMLFFGNKLNLFKEYEDKFKAPIYFQLDMLRSIGLMEQLEKHLSFYKIYVLITAITAICLYQFGKALSRKIIKQ